MSSHALPSWLNHGGHLTADTVVFHATAGSTLSGALDALRKAKLSYHYIIEKDGTVTKCVPLSRVAYHAGNSYGPHEAAKGVSRKQFANNPINRALKRVAKFVAGCSVNGYSIGISFVNLNDGKDQITAAQWEAAIDLVAAIRNQHPIKWITTHVLVSPGRKFDPATFRLGQFCLSCGLTPWRPA